MFLVIFLKKKLFFDNRCEGDHDLLLWNLMYENYIFCL